MTVEPAGALTVTSAGVLDLPLRFEVIAGVWPTGFVVSALNPLFLSNTCPLRESWNPVFSIEFVPAFSSVFSAFLPTVSFPLVVSTSGVSFFSTGLFFNLLFTAVTSFWYAFVNSSWVCAFTTTDFAASTSAFNSTTDSSVLLAYLLFEIFNSTSAI